MGSSSTGFGLHEEELWGSPESYKWEKATCLKTKYICVSVR